MESVLEIVVGLFNSFKSSGYLGYIAILLCIILGHSWINSNSEEEEIESDDEEERDPLRNFTQKQLAAFDGSKDGEDDKPVYLSLNGKVFDVSKGRDFYGPGGPYELFAGHECGAALAKMSFGKEHLDDMAACESLNHGEKMELENWMSKFEHYRCYPVVGALIPDSNLPDPNRILTKEELAKNNGEQGEFPDGYASAPLYIGAGDKVFDASFGGVLFYGKDCPYNLFVGKDASRALAKMSLDPDVANNPDISDLTEKEIKTMNDWIKTFEERKSYPIVGRLESK